jgi:hypothetical protein
MAKVRIIFDLLTYFQRQGVTSVRVGSTYLVRGTAVLAHDSPQRGDHLTMGTRFLLCSLGVKAYCVVCVRVFTDL